MMQSDEIMMTMPNFVFCEGFANHIPEEYRDDLSDVNWAETAFATTNICRDTILTEYDITEDGCIYERDSGNGEIERLEFTGELELAGAVLADEFDYEVEARALFFKGDLKEFDFLRAKKIDNTRRIEASKEMMASIKKAVAYGTLTH